MTTKLKENPQKMLRLLKNNKYKKHVKQKIEEHKLCLHIEQRQYNTVNIQLIAFVLFNLKESININLKT